MQFLIVLAILGAVVLIVLWPVMHRPAPGPRTDRDRRAQGRLAELEAARDAKYREIRDAELDHRTGKLSDADFEALDAGLRAEAIEIVHALDQATNGQASATIEPR